MPVTQLDPKSALIVVDLQEGLVGLPLVHPIADVITQTRKLLDAFRAARQTVVLVNVAGVAPGRTETPRQAYEAGFNVTLATDAMTDRHAEAHDYSLAKVFPRLGETGTADEIIAVLSGR